MLEVLKLTLVLPEEKLSSTPTVDGLLMVVVLSLAKINLRSIDLLLTMLDGLPNLL